MSNHRDRDLLNLAHLLHECCNCQRYVVEGLEPAHQNGIVAGKGQSIKSQDHRHAALCPDGPGRVGCHTWYDRGISIDPTGIYGPTPPEKNEMWTRAHLATFDRYWANGWLKVVTRGRT